MAIKPKPCPFCGKPPEIIPSNPKEEGDAWGAVVCMNSRCPTFDDTRDHGVRVNDAVPFADGRGPEEYKAAAVRRWNRRAAVS